VLNKHGIIEHGDINTLTKTIEEKNKIIETQIQEKQNKFLEREAFLTNQIVNLEKQIDQSNKNLIYYKNKYAEMTERVENIQKLSQQELSINANELKRFYDKKINYSQFELLRENFRKAVDLIETYQLRESLKEKVSK
jgi:hypothetical protein